jgi:hypothetical protein
MDTGFPRGDPWTIPEGINPSKPCAATERAAKRHGRNGLRDEDVLLGRMKALKTEAQERCRGETNPAGLEGRPFGGTVR